MKNILILTTIYFYCSNIIFAQNTFFKTIYMPETNDAGWTVIAEEDGYAIVSGSTCFTDVDFFSCTRVIKTDLEGEIIWDNLLDAQPQVAGGFGSLTRLNNSDYILNGSFQTEYAERFQARLLKFNMQGDTVWLAVYGDSVNTYASRQTHELENGNILALGFNGESSPDFATFHLAEYSPEGEQIFFNKIPASCDLRNTRNFVPTEDGNYLFSYACWASPSTERLMGYAKIDTLGNVIWDQLRTDWQTGCERVNPTIVTLDNGGYAIPWSFEVNFDCVSTLKGFNAAHEEIWEVTFEGNNWQNRYISISYAKKAANGDILLIGYYNEGLPGINNMGFLARVSPEGEKLWQRYYIMEDKPWDFPLFTTLDEQSDGGIIMTGSTEDFDTLEFGWHGNVLLVSVDENGCYTPDCQNEHIYLSHLTPTEEAITDYQEVFFNISPNPAVDFANLHFYNPVSQSDAQIKIFDLRGALLYQQSLLMGEQDLEIDISSFSAGLYLAVYEKGGQVLQQKKLVKQ